VRIVGITGGSGSGKSTLALDLVKSLGTRAALLSTDSYYRDLSPLPPAERARTDFDAPAAIEFDLLAAHLDSLREGRGIRPPIYDMKTHTRVGEAAPVDPAEILVLEGLLLLADARIAGSIDFLVYVDLPEPDRLARRLARDVAERGRSEAEVLSRWRSNVLPMHETHVAPGRARADRVVPGDGDAAAIVERLVADLA
jgi:uridine kinase